MTDILIKIVVIETQIIIIITQRKKVIIILTIIEEIIITLIFHIKRKRHPINKIPIKINLIKIQNNK
jgi:hypothetical protein